jgi:hypothetical protein
MTIYRSDIRFLERKLGKELPAFLKESLAKNFKPPRHGTS